MSYALALEADENSILDRDDLNYEIKLNKSNSSFKDSIKIVKNDGCTPLIKAVNSGSISAVELLLLNGAKLTRPDFNGRTPLHYATLNKNLRIVCLLLKRGADPLALDKSNVDPIMIATDNCQPNIVTILRVAKMNIDLKEQDMTYSGDPMFDDILKDLLALTSSNTNENGESNESSENTTANNSNQNIENN